MIETVYFYIAFRSRTAYAVPSVFACLNFLIALPYRPYLIPYSLMRSERIELISLFFVSIYVAINGKYLRLYTRNRWPLLRENSFQYHTIFGFCRMPRLAQISATTTKACNSFHHFGEFVLHSHHGSQSPVHKCISLLNYFNDPIRISFNFFFVCFSFDERYRFVWLFFFFGSLLSLISFWIQLKLNIGAHMRQVLNYTGHAAFNATSLLFMNTMGFRCAHSFNRPAPQTT